MGRESQNIYFINNMLPRFIYRGDSDPSNKRRLREVYPGSVYGCILTNLSNHGSGLEIFTQSLTLSANKHVGEGWGQSHFLSFSQELGRAMVFASGPCGHKLKPSINDASWDTSLITLETQRFKKIEKLENGVFRCSYLGHLPNGGSNLSVPQHIIRQFAKSNHAGKLSTIVLIDVVSFFDSQKFKSSLNLNYAIKNAKRDSEWLVIPIDHAPDIPGELTSKLDDGCIHSFKCFQFKP